MLRVLPGFADNNLDYFAILPEIIAAAQGIQQAVFADRGREAGNVDEVFLDDPKPGKMFATQRISLGLLGLLLPYLRILLCFLRNLLFVLGHPGLVSKGRSQSVAGGRTPLG